MTLKEHINDIRDKLAERKFRNEDEVSQGIVLRLLWALDWPIFEIQIVVPEYTVENRKVDFALCSPPSKPLVFIEVKKVGNIEEAEQQLFGYALDHGVIPIAVPTDGRKWRFFHQMGQENHRKGKARELDFIEDNSEEIAACLNRYLNYESICTGEAVEAIREDHERGYQQKHTRYLEDNAAFDEVARKVARMLWWRKGRVPWKNMEEMEEEISPIQFSLESILKSNVYADYVKYLMRTTRKPEEFDKWVDKFPTMPKTLGNRMGLPPERVEQMVDEIKKERVSTTREDNEDVKNRNT